MEMGHEFVRRCRRRRDRRYQGDHRRSQRHRRPCHRHRLGVPVVYARKTRPITMQTGAYTAEAPSHTQGGIVQLIVSPEYLVPTDRVLLIDDFLASGQTIAALAELIDQCHATLCGIGCIIEKSFEGGRELLTPLNVPIVALATIDSMDGNGIVVRDDAS